MFIKIGETLAVASFQSADAVMADSFIAERFKKFAAELRKVAPKADDFLYFSAIMLHAAEASAYNSDGSLKKTSAGEDVNVGWDLNGESWKWRSNDPSIKPYKNSNGDIFPEPELLKAYKKWVGRPLCVDHKSNSVDAVRGVILDTYYDHMHKRVVGLCALDKVSYPQLARAVQTGVSHSVSMGTGVGRAICTDCGQVARAERDFCQHMRSKSCYGEINVDLNPIELSIVVNGADPQAKIRTIVAAANNLNKYVALKKDELQKVAEDEEALAKLQDLETDLNKVQDKVSELKGQFNKEDVSSVPYGQSSGTYNEGETELDNDNNINFPARVANNNRLIQEIHNFKISMQDKISNIEKGLGTLSSKLNEELMSKDANINKSGYFQGGGGLNEPAPGKVKYPKDPMNENLRMSGDKQMVGQHNLDTGPVDGMHPGTDSSGKSDLERKEMMSRADRRAEALKKAKENLQGVKRGYFQGGGEGNEPAPGKAKYPKDPMNEDLREGDDKQMVGQKPFPDVGDVEGLHPSPASVKEKDELKRKEMLSRASLRGRFVKAAKTDGTDDFANSAWQVYLDDKLVFTASVNEISGGNVDVLYDTIATKQFGTSMLSKIQSLGLDKAAELYKRSQAVAEPGAAPGLPADPAGAVPAPIPEAAPLPPAPTGELPGGEDNKEPKELEEGGSQDAAAQTKEILSKLETDVSDMKQVVDVLLDEKAEMKDLGEVDKAASVQDKAQKMRKELCDALLEGSQKSVAELEEHTKELNLIASVLESGVDEANKEYVDVIIEDAFTDAKNALAHAKELMAAFVKYAKGTEEIKKEAQFADDYMNDDDADLDELLGLYDEDKEEDKGDEHTKPEKLEDDMNDVGDMVKVKVPGQSGDVEVPVGSSVKAEEEKAEEIEVVAEQEPDLTTKEGRAAYRAKVAAEALKFSDMLDQAHPKGGTATELDVKPSDDLGKVEDLKEKHKKMMDVATAPPKVRKEAERLNQMIVEGKITTEDFDALVSQGLDPEVIKYWKGFYGEAGKEGSEFAAELLKEHAKAEMEKEMKLYRTKIARAYELAHEMVRKGMLADDRPAISAQVDTIMAWNDEAFDSVKRIVSNHQNKSTTKLASGLPQVGIFGADNEGRPQQSTSLVEELEKAFSSKRKY